MLRNIILILLPLVVYGKAAKEIATVQSQPILDSLSVNTFDCPADGYYAVDNECDTYFQCKNRIAVKYMCPDGLHFNPAAKINQYPCAYPAQVQCGAGTIKQAPKATYQCPRQYGYFAMNDIDCSQYIVCHEGQATVMDCPAGLVFNDLIDNCDWPANVPQCNTNVVTDFSCPKTSLEDYNSIFKYKYNNHCQLYIACQRGVPNIRTCGTGLAFDEKTQSCINEDTVARCSTSTIT